MGRGCKKACSSLCPQLLSVAYNLVRKSVWTLGIDLEYPDDDLKITAFEGFFKVAVEMR